jgi:hypothetical protein
MENKINIFEEIIKIINTIPVKINLNCIDNNSNHLKVSNLEFNLYIKKINLAFEIDKFKDGKQYNEIKNKLFYTFDEYYKANKKNGYDFLGCDEDFLEDKKTIVLTYISQPNEYFKKPY